jgi:hypothetical protein
MLQQIAGTLSSITDATQTILGGNPVLIDEVRNLYRSFLTSPTTIRLLGSNPLNATPTTTQPSDSLRKEILAIKDTVSALSKAMSSSSKAAAQKAPNPSTLTPDQCGHPKNKVQKTSGVTHMPTYATKAATPPRPSAVVDLRSITITGPRPSESDICHHLNRALSESAAHKQVQLSAVKWNAKGNLILVAGLRTSATHLNAALDHITMAIGSLIPPSDDTPFQTRANVKWSRILLNCVPTGVNTVHTRKTKAHTPEDCHRALAEENPIYAALHITQEPSWVKNPDSYTPGSASSLTFAFEDPDGTLAASLLSTKILYAFGAMALVKKWKHKPPTKQPSSPPPATATTGAEATHSGVPKTTTSCQENQAPERERRSRRREQARQGEKS